MIGERYGKLEIISKAFKGWNCRCDCGKEKAIERGQLTSGRMKSCGCSIHSQRAKYIRAFAPPKDYINKSFGGLVALEPRRKDNRWWWYCKCECGLFTEVRVDSLENGQISCGCQIGPKSSIPDEEFLDRTVRHSAKAMIWKLQVKKKDNFTCLKCNSKDLLEAHHIVSFADNPELRYEVSNGAALCEYCHKKFHFYYGQANFTRENLDKYLSSPSILQHDIGDKLNALLLPLLRKPLLR